MTTRKSLNDVAEEIKQDMAFDMDLKIFESMAIATGDPMPEGWKEKARESYEMRRGCPVHTAAIKNER